MIAGINKLLEHEGGTYHLQAEDIGVEAGAFELRVYQGGTVLWSKRVSYRDLLDDGALPVAQEGPLRRQMERGLLTVEAAIVKGKLPLASA